MMCELCASMRRTRSARSETGERAAARTAAGSAAACEVCDRPLTAGAAARFVTLLGRLARFGLTGEALLVKKA